MDPLDERARALRVLWIEDDPVLRTAFELVSADLGASVTVVASCEHAEERLANERFDWIVADYRLRGRTADAFVREWVAAGHRVAVVSGDTSSIEPTLDVPVFEKPITVDGLLRALAAS